MQPQTDHELMLYACELAVRGHGCAEPNPMVGCVIVDSNGTMISSGYHEKCGEAHAEINALKSAGPLANGATAIVTLEPCNHYGQTGPCTKAVLDAGIAKVVIGCKDPNLKASGGAAFLTARGVEVVFVQMQQCEKIIRPYVHRLQTGLPWVTCKWAQTADGYIETPETENPWISCEESRHLVHVERGCVDAIIVGVGTVIADNPSLTVRNATINRTPLRVVVDPTLRIPLNASVLNDEVPTLIAHGKNANKKRLASSSVSFIELPTINGALDLRHLLTHIASEYDATNVIIEGGQTLFEHIFDQELANELWLFTSQRTIGNANLKNMTSLFKELDCILEEEYSCGDDLVSLYRIN